MPTLFSYCLRYDNGTAPNPYWDVCTLVICKPVIRRIAKKGDWIVGTGSANSPIGNVTDKLVYAMKITDAMTMQKYDQYTKRNLPRKIPDLQNSDFRRRLGDSIYNFKRKQPAIRKCIHVIGNLDHDLKGERALLSRHFFYFGNEPVDLPDDLQPIIKQGPGHRSRSNDPYVDRFIKWIHSLSHQLYTPLRKPQIDLFINKSLVDACSKGRCSPAEEDEKLPCVCKFTTKRRPICAQYSTRKY